MCPPPSTIGWLLLACSLIRQVVCCLSFARSEESANECNALTAERTPSPNQIYFELQLSIAKETKNLESEASALHGLGYNYGCMGDYGNAMTYLEQALVIQSEWGDDRKRKTYTAMGDVLVAQEGREKEGILMFQKCVGLLEEGNALEKLVGLYLNLGQAYTTIRAWDDAVASLEKGLSIAHSIEDEILSNELNAIVKQDLGNTYLEKYESLPEQNDELIHKALFWSEAVFNLQNSNENVNHALFLDLAQALFSR